MRALGQERLGLLALYLLLLRLDLLGVRALIQDSPGILLLLGLLLLLGRVLGQVRLELLNLLRLLLPLDLPAERALGQISLGLLNT